MNREKRICKTASSSSEEEDRFSDLPESILLHILSFLPTKDAVRTSVLSTNSKCLFLGLGNIRIIHNVHPGMVRFIKRRISSSEGSHVVEFVLEYDSLPKSSVLISWLNALLLCRAKVVHIVESPEKIRSHVFRPRISLPSELFLSDTLEVLKLCGGRFVVKFPEFINCPKLKVLHLNCFTASNEMASRNLRFDDEGYPVLEDLNFGMWDIYSAGVVLSISLTALKRLTFRSIASPEGVRFDIHTPNLEHLNFMDRLMVANKSRLWMSVKEMHFHNGPSLISAVIGQFMEPQWCMSLLSSISNVKELHFEESVLDFEYLAGHLLSFPKLTHLSLRKCHGGSVRYFLHCAPKLEIFIYDGGHVKSSFLDSGDVVPLCFGQTLIEVRLRYLSKDVFAIASFFLQYGAVLKKIIVEHATATALKRLRDMDGSSRKCVIEIHDEEM